MYRESFLVSHFPPLHSHTHIYTDCNSPTAMGNTNSKVPLRLTTRSKVARRSKITADTCVNTGMVVSWLCFKFQDLYLYTCAHSQHPTHSPILGLALLNSKTCIYRHYMIQYYCRSNFICGLLNVVHHVFLHTQLIHV